jgi:hypothetical protein
MAKKVFMPPSMAPLPTPKRNAAATSSGQSGAMAMPSKPTPRTMQLTTSNLAMPNHPIRRPLLKLVSKKPVVATSSMVPI